MTVKEFIETLVIPNTLIRLWYPIKGGHEQVIAGDNPQEEWKLVNSNFSNHKVIGVTDILFPDSHYAEAVNLVMERPTGSIPG
jgi:hypothetical protein